MSDLQRETLDEYLLTYEYLTEKINRFDERIEELASAERYEEKVKHMSCLLGIKTHTALSMIVEVGDFERFEKAPKFASFLGLVPSEDSSDQRINRYSITKAGNSHLRRLLVEAAQSYTRGTIGHMEYNNMVIGDSIRELRKAHHMTQMELAEKLDISFTHCSQLEQGRHKMSVDLLFRMMTLFQVDANTILGIKETEEERNAKLFSGIQDKIDGLEPKQREQFLNSCKLMLDGFSARKESMVR